MNSKYDEKEEYTSFLEHIKEERNDSSNFAKSLLSFVLGMCCVLAFTFWFINHENLVKAVFGEDSPVTKELLGWADSIQNRGRTSFNLPTFGRPKNILLLGVDSNGEGTDKWEGTRTDTIILMNVDPGEHSINAISIPRDSKVYIDDHGINKINSAHAFGGIKLCKKTIEDTLGVRVDKYIMVHDDAVKDVVDALGGVPIYVEKRMNYDDYAGKLHIHLNKGMNVLNGTQAVGYLRFRHDGLGDIGRTQRQQWFLKGLIDTLKTPQALSKLPELLNVAREDIKTDMSVYELSQLANAARGLSDGGIQIATLPGAPNKNGYISYWILDPEKVQDVVDRLIYREDKTADTNSIVAGIMYSSSKRNEAEDLKNQLTDMGYKVNCLEMESLPHSQFIAHNNNVSNNFYNYLRKRVSTLEKIQYVYDPVRNYCVNSDFTIVLSN